MAGPIVFVATNRLKDGALELERTRVVQIHPDAASLEKHLGVIADHALRAYEETLDRTVSSAEVRVR